MKIQHIIENLPAQSHTGQIQNNLCYCKTMLFINDIHLNLNEAFFVSEELKFSTTEVTALKHSKTSVN